MPHRYFTTEISNGTATLRGADAHHLSRVMRGKLGDTVILCDGNAVEYTATITGFGPETVEFSVEPGYPSAAEPSVEVTLFVGYPKQDKLEQVIRHGVELGCTHFVPFFSRYCVAAGAKGKAGVKDQLDAVGVVLLPGGHDGQPFANVHGVVVFAPAVLPVLLLHALGLHGVGDACRFHPGLDEGQRLHGGSARLQIHVDDHSVAGLVQQLLLDQIHMGDLGHLLLDVAL